MTAKEPLDKQPAVITPKEESEYDRMIRERMEAQMDGCCEGGGYKPRYDYKPRPTALQDVPETEKKNSKQKS